MAPHGRGEIKNVKLASILCQEVREHHSWAVLNSGHGACQSVNGEGHTVTDFSPSVHPINNQYSTQESVHSSDLHFSSYSA